MALPPDSPFISTLERWYLDHADALQSAGIRAKFKKGPQTPKPGAGLILQSANLEAEVLVWSSGEAEVFVGTATSPEIGMEHHVLTGPEELRLLLDGVRGRLDVEVPGG